MRQEKKKLIYASTIPQSLDTFWRGFLRQQAKDNTVIALSYPGEAMERRISLRILFVFSF